MIPIRVPVGPAEAKLAIVESQDGGIFLAFEACEPFDSDEPGLAICVASPETALVDLVNLRDVVCAAILELKARAS